MPNAWIEKLKVFNGYPDHKLNVWAIPKKDTEERRLLDSGHKFNYILNAKKEEPKEEKKEEPKEEKPKEEIKEAIQIIEQKEKPKDEFLEFLDKCVEEGGKMDAKNIWYAPYDVWMDTIILRYLEDADHIKSSTGFIFHVRENRHKYVLNLEFNRGSKYEMPPAIEISSLGHSIMIALAVKKDLLFLPFTMKNHQNLMIYRHKQHVVEHYEPHGDYFQGDLIKNKKYKELEKQLKEAKSKQEQHELLVLLKEEMNNIFKEHSKKFTTFLGKFFKELSYVVPGIKTVQIKSPDYISRGIKGFQDIESQQKRNIIAPIYAKQMGGFCVMWTAFYLESMLKHPNESSPELFKRVHDYVSSKGENAFFNLMVGYVKQHNTVITSIVKDYDAKTHVKKEKNSEYYIKYRKHVDEKVKQYKEKLLVMYYEIEKNTSK
jgi:hypothetical protein